MPHSKCLRCRSRVWHDSAAGTVATNLCPGCGSELEPVLDLSELVGLRALQPRPHDEHRHDPDRSQRISQQIRETIARHDAARRRGLDRGGT
jgi:hypothetical protein